MKLRLSYAITMLLRGVEQKTRKQVLGKIQSILLARHILVIKYSFARKHFQVLL